MTDVSAAPGIPMPAPLYRELERRMLDALASGEWKPGDAIPAERRLAERYSVSIGTVRKAIDALVDANLLIRQQGRGTFVATHTRDRLLYYFFHVVPEGGAKEYPDVRTVTFARGKADRVEAEKLAIALADPVIRVRNLLHLGGEPIILDDLTLSAARFPGLTEKQFAAMIVEEMHRTPGLSTAWEQEHCPAVFTGPDSAGAHAGPTDRAIEPGHIVNVDFGVRRNGFCSDLQRTWYVLRAGETQAPAAVQRGFDTILKSIRDAAAAIRPGVTGAAIDDVARGVVTAAGYDEYPHGTGHQIGRVAHDGGGGLLPRWERYGDRPLLPIEAGQCFTIEPRLTVAGHGIATCEDIVVVEEGGAKFLSRPQEALWLVGAR